MATSQEGWPLGLQPLSVGIGFEPGRVNFGSVSFNTTTMITGSPTSSTGSSSDLDTESTGSFFHDRSITLGSLIGVSSILEFSRRSVRPGRRPEPLKVNKPCKSKPWIFSLCSRDSIDVKSTINNTPSLGQFLAVERQVSNELRRSTRNPNEEMPDEYSFEQPISQPNSLFEDGRIAPPQSSSESESGPRRNSTENGNNNGVGVPMIFSCMCGHESPSNVSH